MIGATTFLGGAYRLAERCGPAVAREIVYTTDHYSAEQFAKWNIVNRVFPLLSYKSPRDDSRQEDRTWTHGGAHPHQAHHSACAHA